MSLKQQLERADKQLAELSNDEIDDATRFDVAQSIINRAHKLALEHHAADAAKIVENVTAPLSPKAGRRLLAAMLSTLDTSELLNLAQSADYLGYSTHGLRKIVKQGLIRFTRNGTGPYRFQRDWLDEFTTARPSDRRPAQKRRKPVEPRHGFPSC
jgi:hypothetical protein